MDSYFEWDEGNIGHIARHGVEVWEAEEALQDPARHRVSAYAVKGESRRAFIGKTDDGRILMVIYTKRQQIIRVLMARDATPKEKLMPEMRLKEKQQDVDLIEVNSWDEVPEFGSEDEEAEFWSTHSLGDPILAQMKPVPEAGDDDLPPARPKRQSATSIRFDALTLRRLKTLARRRGVGYQTLLKTFVAERLYEEEKREGIVG